MLAFGRQCRFPFSPAASSRDPIDAASPRLYVCMGDETYWRVGISVMLVRHWLHLLHLHLGFSGLL
jgi:hypothetical protein